MTAQWIKPIHGWGQSRLDTAADLLDADPYGHSGAPGPARLHELGGGFVLRAVAGGAFPRDLFGTA
ncbi:hypothetical protein [Streptomyces sp. cmx-4-9]|uniref:hypothetical protein n=1 Tax=Streptomyces sp. cmx-4-9 TaxID=2790941 RepID=UPI00397FEA79